MSQYHGSYMSDWPQNSNFSFLAVYDERLVKLGRDSERLASLSPNACIMQIRTLAELIAREAVARLGLYNLGRTNFADVLKLLERESAFNPDICNVFHEVRKEANLVVHGEVFLGDAFGVAKNYIKLARRLAIWLHESFGDPKFKPGPFIDPPDLRAQREEILSENADLKRLVDDVKAAVDAADARALEEKRRRATAEEVARKFEEELNVYRELAEEYEARLAILQKSAEAASPAEVERRESQFKKAADGFALDESETRALIDLQLIDAGWNADSQVLRWSQGTRPIEGECLAIAEVPTAEGPADYVLFDGLVPVAVVEAKRRSRDVQGSLEQAKRYARAYKLTDDQLPPGGPWQVDSTVYAIPFVFATNGREYLHQLETKSGVWFQDMRRPVNQPRALSGWYSPDGLKRLLKSDTDAALARLKAESFDYLGLRPFQREAINAIERAVADGRRTALLAMATGTGKTRTALGLIYRVIKSGLFNRVLFLVDRTTLGGQAYDAFETTKLENFKSLTETYEVKNLSDALIETDTKVSIATIQSMVARVLEGEQPPPIDQFDCIIIDECHRGYNLDREMSDVELEHRDAGDYISRYRRVLDYFDAMLIGLTATPALHTSEIFGRPVYNYRFSQAVIDGYLVDQAPLIKVTTELAESGLHIESGAQVTFVDKKTGEISFADAPDEIDFEIDSFNRAVITEGFNRVVCEDIASRIDPDAPGKTLIFCVTKAHAYMVEAGLREAYAARGRPVTDTAIKVIVGDSDDPKGLLRRYKNEQKPSIAITVDYLTTGIDVPQIVNIVFLRRVRSRILYEQMKGRATRLCDEIHKTAFRIYDYVGIYDALESVTDMKPVVQRPDITIEQVFDELTTADDPALLKLAHGEFIAKLNRRVQRFSDDGHRRFEEVAAMSAEEFLRNLRDQSPEDAGSWLADKRPVIDQLPTFATVSGGVIYDDTPDRVIKIEELAADREDYLDGFEAYVLAHIDQMEALHIVTRRPRDLTRKALLELRQQLASAGYHEDSLRRAWAKRTNQDVAASIIGFVRQAALGEPLIPYEERVNQALHKIYESQAWTAEQRHWLERIAKSLINDGLVPDSKTLDEAPAFRSKGGFERISKRYFDGRLGELLHTFNDTVWN